MFIKRDSEHDIKTFFMEDIDELLKKYEPGEPKMKPDVLEQIKIIEAKHEQMEAEMNEKNQGGLSNIIMEQNGQGPKNLTNNEVVALIKQQQSHIELLTKQEFQKLQNLIIVALTSGLFIPPRRAIDWVEMVVDDIDKEKDNYLDVKKKEFVFNKFKGSVQKGTQRVPVPKELLLLLKKFMNINENKYLLVDSRNQKMSSVKLNQHLERIWGKKAGVNIFRHSFISNKYPIFNVEQLKKDAEKMGSSANMMLETYIKKD
jgi:integrase